MSEHLREPALVVIKPLFGLIVCRTHVDYDIAGIENSGISSAFQFCGTADDK